MRRHRAFFTVVALAALIGSLVVAVPAAGEAAETPRRGGMLLAAIAADAPTLDPHQEQTFATIQMVAPLYSTLLQIDPLAYPKIIGDAATDWKIAPDRPTYTFKLRQGIRFHDGSPLTAADVKATYDKIASPPPGVRHPEERVHRGRERRGAGSDDRSVQAQVPVGIAPVQPRLAVERDLPEEISRQGPEPLQGERRRLGSVQAQERHAWRDVRGRAQPRLLHQGPPVPRRLQVLHQHGDVGACRGDKIVVQDTPATGLFGIAMNRTMKPFNDVRVRNALTLAFDRPTAGKVLHPLASLKDVGAPRRDGSSPKRAVRTGSRPS